MMVNIHIERLVLDGQSHGFFWEVPDETNRAIDAAVTMRGIRILESRRWA